MASTVTVNIVGDADSLKKALGDADTSLQKFGQSAQRVGERATSIGRSMTLGVTLPLIGLGKVAFDELQESAAASAQTAAAIKSTGGAANVTARQVDELAASLLKKTGIDDEAIKSGENLLLTFKNIRNEAGKGNDIFDQATKATLDLSIAFGKDMASSAVLVGKALNDPIKGLTALSRVGVQFTEQQKEQIKALVESGDVMGAQKVILAELTSEVGGSGEAFGNSFAGQVSKAKEELKNTGATILASALPAIKEITGVAIDAAEGFSELPEPVQEAALAVAALVAASGPLTYVFGAFAKAAGGIASAIAFVGETADTAYLKVLLFNDAVKEVGLINAIAASGIGAAALALGGFAIAGLGVAAISYGIVEALGLGERSLNSFERAGHQAALGAFRDATASGDAYDSLKQRLASVGSALDLFTAKAKSLGASVNARTDDIDAMVGVLVRGNSATQRAAGTFQTLRREYDEIEKALRKLKPQHDEFIAQQKVAEAQARAQQRAIKDVASGTTEWGDATEETKNSILDLQSAVLAASGGELGLQQANLNLTKAQQDYTDALNSGDPQAIADAELNLEQARLSVASATLQAQDANDKLIAIVKQGPAAVQAEINKLKDAQTTYGDTSGKIQEQIDKLTFLNGVINGIPEHPKVVVDLSFLNNAIENLVFTRDTLNDLTSREHQIIVTLGGDPGLVGGYTPPQLSDLNLKRDVRPVLWI